MPENVVYSVFTDILYLLLHNNLCSNIEYWIERINIKITICYIVRHHQAQPPQPLRFYISTFQYFRMGYSLIMVSLIKIRIHRLSTRVFFLALIVSVPLTVHTNNFEPAKPTIPYSHIGMMMIACEDIIWNSIQRHRKAHFMAYISRIIVCTVYCVH